MIKKFYQIGGRIFARVGLAKPLNIFICNTYDRAFILIWTHIWTHPVLQDTVSFVTRKRLLPYIRPVDADVSPLALMNSARLDLNILSASKEPSNKPGFQDDGLTCLVINLYCVLATC